MHDVNRGLDDSLSAVSLVAFSEMETKLDKALKDTLTIETQDLEIGLSKLSVSGQTKKNLVDVLSKSLAARTVSLDDVIAQLQKSVTDDVEDILTKALHEVLKKMGNEVVFAEFVNSAKADVLVVLCGGVLKDDALDKALTQKELFCLKPVPDLSEEIAAALAKGTPTTEILAHINKTIGETLSCSTLASTVLGSALGLVYAGEAKLDVLKDHSELLTRILSVPVDMTAQVSCVFQAQQAWITAGAKKKGAAALFLALYETGIISPEAFVEWRDDMTQFKKTKIKALLEVSSWIVEIEPKEDYYSDEGDEGDEQEDAY